MFQGKTRLLTALLMALMCVALAGGEAMAKKGSELTEVLGEAEWGDSKREILQKMQKSLLEKAAKDPRYKDDRAKLQRKRKDILDEIQQVEKDYKRLVGRTGLENSVIAEEFTSNNGESMLKIKDEVAQRFFFFVDGKFYKLVVAYNPVYLRGGSMTKPIVGFEAFVVQAARKYGRPATTEYGDVEGGEELIQAVWRDPLTELRVDNRSEFFGTYTMTFSDRQAIKRLQAVKKSFGGAGARAEKKEQLSGRVKSLGEGGAKIGGAQVDSIYGGKVELDFNEGRPKDDQIRYPEDEEGAAVAEAEPEKKKKKKRSKKKRSKKKANFDNLDTAGGDDLIIY